MRFTDRNPEDNRVVFNIDDGLDQDLFRYCEKICMENCGSTFNPECGDCHVTRLYYAMLYLAEYEDTGLTPKQTLKLLNVVEFCCGEKEYTLSPGDETKEGGERVREIKFRGKTVASMEGFLNESGIPHENKWVFGAYVHNNGKPFIISHNVVDACEEYFCPESWWWVSPETVGQYTGHHDIKGAELYEDDLLQSQIGDRYIWRIIFDDGAFYLEQINGNKMDICCDDDISFYRLVKIGNIHDNPELLEVQE